MTAKPRPKKYACSFEGCDKRYSRPALLAQHERTHSNDRPFACDFEGCDKAFFRKSHLEVHKCSHQKDNEMRFQCKICGKGVIDAQRLRRHELTHTKKHKCPYEGCNESFYHHISYKHHIESVHEMVTVCDICHRRFQNKVLLAKHKLKEHGEGETFSCSHPGCFSTFVTERNLKDHIRKEHPKIKCKDCASEFDSPSALKAHMLVHGDPSGKSSENDEATKSDDSRETEDKLVASKEDKKHTEMTATDISNLSGSSIISLMSGNFKQRYKCPRSGCGRVFERKHAYDKHMEKHKWEREQAEKKLQELEREEQENAASEIAEVVSIESDHFSDLDEDNIIDEESEPEASDTDNSMVEEVTERQEELDLLLAQEMQNIN
ncbi:hypothetical protein FT663_01864 [Candidozyma haemuli var. vulneris]|uniref:C2H2-type domain-containing protein n=1 Tax=Candidozyma haemuli TaxID=45357 RepID=A0A2V1AMW2_9ASCO|nr:hypothetical protein CXQ85_003254 [[Candida] haemuloni]KAF3993529.1 hypothetical protein FT663_01864 [[Candida] haemuloni var. vulneris]KAF3993893.1 hypothetical protein FT662_00341 [[Candida] haemuloni var. vulneris]PVH19410.1 hypothetical protein CXQ85_003254 [[Candida] haemuloni]